jgi:hypothetical protein
VKQASTAPLSLFNRDVVSGGKSDSPIERLPAIPEGILLSYIFLQKILVCTFRIHTSQKGTIIIVSPVLRFVEDDLYPSPSLSPKKHFEDEYSTGRGESPETYPYFLGLQFSRSKKSGFPAPSSLATDFVSYLKTRCKNKHLPVSELYITHKYQKWCENNNFMNLSIDDCLVILSTRGVKPHGCYKSTPINGAGLIIPRSG